MTDLRRKVVKGGVWAVMERLSVRGMSFVVTIVLARLLTPSDYGVVALLAIFISIASVLADSGLGNALVQKKDASDLDFNSVFYLSIIWTSLIYGVLFLCAPLIAVFYKNPSLTAMVRVLGLTILFHSINSVQMAELNRKLRFDKSFRVSMVVAVVQGVVGISLAFCGCGPWALVWSQISAGIMQTITLWFVIAWRPRMMYSGTAVLSLFRYGWKLTASELLNVAYGNLSGLVIGKLYTKEDLAFVQKGGSIPFLGMELINGTLGRVAFPALSQLQNDSKRLREAMRRMIQCSTFFVFPLMTGCAVCAEQLVLIMFGPQWLPCVPYVQLACIGYALWPFHTINLQAISARGRSDIYLKLEIIKKIFGVVLIAASFRYGVFAMVLVSTLAGGPIGLLLNAWPNSKYLGYSLKMQVRDVVATTFASSIMLIVVYFSGSVLKYTAHCLWGVGTNTGMPIHLTISMLICQVMIGMVVFGSVTWYMRSQPLVEIEKILSPYIKPRWPHMARRIETHLGIRP